jgi:hypothetical protein
MTATAKFPESGTSPAQFQIAFRDDVTQADRQNAERSVATLVARAGAAVARARVAEADLAELADALNGPIVKLIQGDPVAVKALAKLRNRQLFEPDAIGAIRQGAPAALTYEAIHRAPQGVPSPRLYSAVPPYDFSWAWHDQNGSPPFNQDADRPSGHLALDARCGNVPGGASSFVNAHAGFGVFLSSNTTAQRFPHALLNPGWFSHKVRAIGIGSNATSEGGFELTVFEDGQFLIGASRKLWRKRVSANETDVGGEPQHVIEGPDLQFTIRAGHGYTFNAGIWVSIDRSNGIGEGGGQSLLEGVVTNMWVS